MAVAILRFLLIVIIIIIIIMVLLMAVLVAWIVGLCWKLIVFNYELRRFLIGLYAV